MTARDDFVPRCACGAAIGWTRLIRRLPCAACAIRNAQAKAGVTVKRKGPWW